MDIGMGLDQKVRVEEGDRGMRGEGRAKKRKEGVGRGEKK